MVSLDSRDAVSLDSRDANFPLRVKHAKELLKVLDALIDGGDRRSAALEQSEVFRGVQV